MSHQPIIEEPPSRPAPPSNYDLDKEQELRDNVNAMTKVKRSFAETSEEMPDMVEVLPARECRKICDSSLD
jgi:hypothetical protein